MQNTKMKLLICDFLERTQGITGARLVLDDLSSKNRKEFKKAFPKLFLNYSEGEWIITKEEIVIKKD